MYITDKDLTLLKFSNGVVLAMCAKKWEEERGVWLLQRGAL